METSIRIDSINKQLQFYRGEFTFLTKFIGIENLSLKQKISVEKLNIIISDYENRKKLLELGYCQ